MKNSTKKLMLNRERTKKWFFSLLILCLLTFNSSAQCLMHDGFHDHGEEDLKLDNDFTNLTESGEETPICYIAINMHFIADDNGNGNFRPYDDGHGNTSYTGYTRAEQLIDYCNYMLANNAPMKLGSTAGQTAFFSIPSTVYTSAVLRNQ
jgi:hypothetical protein